MELWGTPQLGLLLQMSKTKCSRFAISIYSAFCAQVCWTELCICHRHNKYYCCIWSWSFVHPRTFTSGKEIFWMPCCLCQQLKVTISLSSIKPDLCCLHVWPLSLWWIKIVIAELKHQVVWWHVQCKHLALTRYRFIPKSLLQPEPSLKGTVITALEPCNKTLINHDHDHWLIWNA